MKLKYKNSTPKNAEVDSIAASEILNRLTYI